MHNHQDSALERSTNQVFLEAQQMMTDFEPIDELSKRLLVATPILLRAYLLRITTELYLAWLIYEKRLYHLP